MKSISKVNSVAQFSISENFAYEITQWTKVLFFHTSFKWSPKSFILGSLKYGSKTEYAKQKRPLEFNSYQRLRMFLSLEGTRQLKTISVKILRARI